MKRCITAILLVCWLVGAYAQKMEDVFLQMPDEFIVQLDRARRKELVDLYKSRNPATLSNTMQGKSVLNKLSDYYLKLQTTEQSVVELKLLPLVNNTFVICMIQTVYGPIADSNVSFYTTEWQRIATKDVFLPVTEDWFWKKDSDRDVLDVLSQMGIFLVKYSLSDEGTTLTAEYMTPTYLDDENQEIVKPFLRTENKTYEWKSGRYE